jgi:DNA invertase Pin-like site-specific DNA recombinase
MGRKRYPVFDLQPRGNAAMRIGYARVSTDDQTRDLQRDALKRAKCRDIYEEHASGKNTAGPQLVRASNQASN